MRFSLYNKGHFFFITDTEEDSLRQAFSSCGNVEGVRLVRDSASGAGKGFGFVLFQVFISIYDPKSGVTF